MGGRDTLHPESLVGYRFKVRQKERKGKWEGISLATKELEMERGSEGKDAR